MKKLSALLAASALALGATSAQAATFTPGTHTFTGPIFVEKDNGPFACDLTIVVTATSSAATAQASLTGSGGICNLIAITPVSLPVSLSGSTVTFGNAGTPIRITPPLSTGYCEGTLSATWGGNSGTTRTITFSSPLSDVTKVGGVNDCMIDGVVDQTSSPLLDIS